MSKKLLIVCAFFMPVTLFAQTVAIPNSGTIFDSASHSLRPLVGFTGAATLGPSLSLASNVTASAICSSKNFSLLASGDQSTVKLLHLNGSAAATLPVGVLTAPDQIMLSASCSTGLLFSAATNHVQLITDLPGAPKIAADLNLSIAGFSAFAVNDDGSAILGVVPGDGVYLLSGATTPQRIAPLAGNAGVAFRNNLDGLIADAQGNQILVILNVLSSSNVQVLAGSDQGIQLPSSVAYDADSQFVYVGNSGASNLGLLNPADGTVKFLDCGCQVSFAPLADRVYAIAAPVNGSPLLILDATSPTPKVLFVASRP